MQLICRFKLTGNEEDVLQIVQMLSKFCFVGDEVLVISEAVDLSEYDIDSSNINFATEKKIKNIEAYGLLDSYYTICNIEAGKIAILEAMANIFSQHHDNFGYVLEYNTLTKMVSGFKNVHWT